ncbi:Metallothionein-like protein 4A [Nymphaea thermarum]|nr:Metallothionein-like protein 4A [Nymphaea thermarum]
MSCCGGNCGCGSGCKCGNGCGGCKMYPEISMFSERTVESRIVDVSSETGYEEVFEGAMVTNGGCNCGPKCSSPNCGCHK